MENEAEPAVSSVSQSYTSAILEWTTHKAILWQTRRSEAERLAAVFAALQLRKPAEVEQRHGRGRSACTSISTDFREMSYSRSGSARAAAAARQRRSCPVASQD